MRHGALPATMAAPMTSSEDLPAGICSAVTFWSGFAVFQAATACSPQATSCSLLEYQILIGPTAVSASPPPVLPPLPPPHAASVKVMARPTARYPSGRFMVFLLPVCCARDLSLIHISEPTRQAEISYAVFCLKKKKT